MSDDKLTEKEKRLRDKFTYQAADIVIIKKPKPKTKKASNDRT